MHIRSAKSRFYEGVDAYIKSWLYGHMEKYDVVERLMPFYTDAAWGQVDNFLTERARKEYPEAYNKMVIREEVREQLAKQAAQKTTPNKRK